MIAEIGADVIALQEADRRFGDRAGLLDLAALERSDRPRAGAGRRTATAGTAGTATWCWCARALVRGLHQIALPGLEPRGALVADLDLAAGPVRVVAAHLGLLRHSRLLQVEALLAHAGEATDRPVVLMGDLNEWRPRRRSALQRLRAGLRAGRRTGCRAFPSYFPVLALDRILARPHGASSARSRRTTRRSRGSPRTTCRSRRWSGSTAPRGRGRARPCRGAAAAAAARRGLLAAERPAP